MKLDSSRLLFFFVLLLTVVAPIKRDICGVIHSGDSIEYCSGSVDWNVLHGS